MQALIGMKIQDAFSGDAGSEHVNGARRLDWAKVARRAKDGISDLPVQLADRIKAKPISTLGLTAVVGVAAGVVLGSRLLRAVVSSAVSYGVVEIARGYLRDEMMRPGAPSTGGHPS